MKKKKWIQCPWCGLWFFGSTRFCCHDHYKKWWKVVENDRLKERRKNDCSIRYGICVSNGIAGGRI